jgi:AraC-like DNA-binding protein
MAGERRDDHEDTQVGALAVYREWAVESALTSLLVCAWHDPGARVRRPVLPDACIDLVWDGAALHVAGPDTAAAPVVAAQSFVGLRFRPGVAPVFLGVAAHELRDRHVPLAELWGREADQLAEQMASRQDDPTAPLERALAARLPTLRTPDPLIGALHRELAARSRGAQRLDDFATRRGVSARTLHRRALDALGYGPKTLARIVRFRRALHLGRAGLAPARVAAAAGYADQAHLARECRRLAGMTPGELFADRAVIVSADR